MALAPVTPQPSEMTTKTSDDMTPKVAAVPSITIFGCGGCGINTVRNVREFMTDDVTSKFIDTSSANLRTHEDALIVGSGDGSGKVRAANADHVNQKITGASDEDLSLSDLSVVVFSLSGGSGSVVGPIVLREMHRRGSQVIAICVADTSSYLDTQNTLNSLKSLQAISMKNDIYLPIMVFDNNDTRNTVDHLIHRRMSQFLNIMVARVIEVDKSDRLNWLNGHKTSQATAGLRLMHVASGISSADDDGFVSKGEIWSQSNDVVLDSIITIGSVVKGKESSGVTFFDTKDAMTRVIYQGIFVDAKIPPHIGLVMNGTKAMEKTVKRIEAKLENFATFSRDADSVIPSGSDESPSGLIL